MSASLGMRRVGAEAGRAPDWKPPQLARQAMEDARGALSRQRYADSRSDLAPRRNPQSPPRVPRADPPAGYASVIAFDCGAPSRWPKYRKKNGAFAADKTRGRQAIKAEVNMQQHGEWQVARFARQGAGSW
ncbi:hypothetical protein [Streptomyces sp. NPDC055189]